MHDINYNLLETQGYLVVPQFLNSKEINFFKKDYITSKPNDYIANLTLFEVSKLAIWLIEKKVNALLEIISKQTNLDVDLMIPAARYYDNQRYYNDVTQPHFHTDHQIFYFLQQFYNYLNFWIPITKPDPNKSGLTMIPLDKLAKLIPDYMDLIINKGASRYFPDGNYTKFINDDTGEEIILPCNIASIAVSPTLVPGDLLLMRGDVIHMGQDTETTRLSISLRCTQSSAPIDKNKVFIGGILKQETIKAIPAMVQKLLDICQEKNSDIITASDWYQYAIDHYKKQISQIKVR